MTDLRTAITKALVVGWAIDDEAHTFEASTDAVLAVLADPVRRLAILSLVGDTARCLACPRCGEPFRAPHAGPMPMEYDPGAYTSSEKSCPCCTRPPFGEPAFVVRPRGEGQ